MKIFPKLVFMPVHETFSAIVASRFVFFLLYVGNLRWACLGEIVVADIASRS